jgi:hypothetical protein
MRVILAGVPLETTEYTEGASICFSCVTANDEQLSELEDALTSQDRVLILLRAGERIPVRVRAHEMTPPPMRQLGGAVHRHVVELEQVPAAVVRPILTPVTLASSLQHEWVAR